MAMAVAAEESIKKEVTCPLCLDIFEEPKKLPCDHIYCKECLQGCVEEYYDTIRCPECRAETDVPQGRTDNLPTAFHINRLKEVYYAMQKEEEASSALEKKGGCMIHNSQTLDIYCKTCDELLCPHCLLKSGEHNGHDHCFIDELVKTAQKLGGKISTAVDKLSEEKQKIESQKVADLEQLHASIAATISALNREEEQIRLTIEEEAQQKADILTKQHGRLSIYLTDLSRIADQVQAQKDEKTRNKKDQIQKLQQVCSDTEQSLEPAERADCVLCFRPPEEMVDHYKEGIYKKKLANPEKCFLESFNSFEVEREKTGILQVRDYAGVQCTHPQDINVELTCIREDKQVECNVTLTPMGNYTISVTPQSRGRHVLSVKVNDAHISGSPFSVYVQMPPQLLAQPIRTIREVKKPCGVFSCNDKLYITSSHHNLVTVLNEDDEIVKTYPLKGVSGIAADSQTEEWFATTANKHQLHKFTKEDIHTKIVGKKGRELEKFDTPEGIQVNRDVGVLKLFVCDSMNHRIQVFDRDLHFQGTIGKKGSSSGCFNKPTALAFDETGNFYVTEQENHRIQKLSPDGSAIHTIGNLGKKPQQFNRPIGIAIQGQYMYVVDSGNKRVSVFTTQGEFVTTFGNGVLCYPRKITIDRDGYVYVTDNGEIFVF